MRFSVCQVQMTMFDREPELMRSALHWRAVIDGDGIPTEEQRAFQAWLDEDPSHRAAYDEAKRFWDELGTLKRAVLYSKQDHDAQSPRRAAKSTYSVMRSRKAFMTGIAASAVVAALIWYVRIPEPGPDVYATDIGAIDTVTLEDGSFVTLGARSTINVSYDDEQRSVELVEGDAFFSVLAETRPFEVTSGTVRTRVLGTEFAVRRTNLETHVAVAEGSVEVRHAGSSSLDGQERRQLEQGQRLVSAAGGALGDVIEIDPDMVGAWRHHRLVYEEEPLSNLVNDLNRYRERPLAIEGPDLAAVRVTATFDARDIDLVLQALTEIYAIDVVEHGEQTVLRPRD